MDRLPMTLYNCQNSGENLDGLTNQSTVVAERHRLRKRPVLDLSKNYGPKIG